ncbi:hypothetical protein FKM82_019613 [Ascaphus truei]
MDTAPCLPRNNKVLMKCRNNSATFSWERSRGARSYVAVVRENEDLVNSCDTEGTVCTVTNLTCGTIYSFSVSATDAHCNSAFTAPIMSGVVPCPPGQVETSIYHRSVKPQEVEISWDGSPCGEDYMATVTGEIENDPGSLFILDSYWTSYMLFYIPVPCSSSYNVTVTARNLAGESSPSAPISSYTAPCAPRVKPLVRAGETMQVSWEASVLTEEYRVVDAVTNSTVCRTGGLSCEIPLTPRNLQVIATNPSGESEPTVIAEHTTPTTP